MKTTINLLTLRFLLAVLLLSFCSCKKFLELKPDAKLVIPKTLNDCQALMDDYATMNAQYPSDGELASDNFYIRGEDYLSMADQKDRDTYTWNAEGEHLTTQWLVPYQAVYNANLALQVLDKIVPAQAERQRWNELRGTAHFFRAYAFYQLAQVFAEPYNAAMATGLPGIPLRLSPDLSIASQRGNLKQCYQQIIDDFTMAANVLPLTTALPTRPTKAAAYAALARTYLSMQQYSDARNMATESLKLKSDLMDYNSLDLDAANPFTQFNKEVIFHALSGPKDALDASIARVDPDLINSYAADDLRLKAFFQDNGDGFFVFKGNYNGSSNSTDFFGGLATDELYLIRAESAARQGDLDMALQDLNMLLKKRIAAATHIPFHTTDLNTVISKILSERRKELLSRNLRWTDLRRLNQDPSTAISLKRTSVFNGEDKVYTLPPNDLRYTFLIPLEVINQTNLQQNRR